MEQFITLLNDNSGLIIAGLLGALAIFKLVAKLTPNKTDDVIADQLEDIAEDLRLKDKAEK